MCSLVLVWAATGFTAPRPPVGTAAFRLRMQAGGPAGRIALIWNSPEPFVYETLYGGAEQAPLGRSALRFETFAQALALGRKLQVASPRIQYNVYEIGEGTMELKGSYPKSVNAEGARVRFRRRTPRTGGADDGTLLGVGGMGDDIWRELIERDGWGSLDDAWSKFRRELELSRDEIEAVDEQGNRIDFGADVDPEDDDPIYD